MRKRLSEYLTWFYGFNRPAIVWELARRLADFLEKLAVAGFAVALFYNKLDSMLLPTLFICVSFFITALNARYNK